MNSNWQRLKISDLGTVVSGGTPSTKNSDNWDGKVSWITPKDLSGYLERYISKGERNITDKGLRSSSAKLLPNGTVLFSSRAPIGYVAIAEKELCTNQGFKNIVPNSENHNIFIFYLLRYLTDDIKNVAGGSTFSEISGTALKNINIYIPKLAEQKSIANILSSLDDKIELNNKINKNLEEIAQTLYKRWFVDFEFPNENGEPYKSSGGEMVDSELGMIPKGWKVKKQGTYFPVITGKKNANVATQEGKYKFFTCSRQIYRTDDFSFEGDAILIAGNGDFNVKYYSGKFEAYQRTYVLIPYNSKLSGLLFTAIKYNLNNITTGFRGSVINFITKGHIDDYLVAFPEDNKLEQLAGIFKNALETIALNNVENEKLAQIRDELLPKLMSGEIEVPVEE